MHDARHDTGHPDEGEVGHRQHRPEKGIEALCEEEARHAAHKERGSESASDAAGTCRGRRGDRLEQQDEESENEHPGLGASQNRLER